MAAARGSVPRASAFSSSVSVEHAQRQDLVDLRRVEEVARALGRDRRMVVEDDRRREHHGVGLVDEHRPGALVVARRERRPPRPRADRAGTGTRRPRPRAACAPRRASGAPSSSLDAPGCDQLVVFSTVTPSATKCAGPRRPVGGHVHDARHRAHARAPPGQRCRTRPQGPRCRCPPGSTNGNAVGSPRGSTEIGGRSISCSTASSHGTHIASPTTSSSTGPIHSPAADCRSSAAALHLQAPHSSHAGLGASPGSIDALGARTTIAHDGSCCDLGRRHEHAELPADLVLPRRGSVRIQDVALVENGVGDRAGRRRTGRSLTAPPSGGVRP